MIYVLLIVLILGVIAMSIYYGNTKIGKIFFGSTAIGKVYHGSTLVFQSMKKVPVYGYSNNRYLLGSNSTSGIVFSASNRTADTITAITGTLGASGSKIKTSSTSSAFNNEEFTYYTTLTFNGVKIYMYATTESNVFWAEYVIEDARVGSACLHDTTVLFDGNPDIHPSSVTSSGMTRRGSSSTFTRVTSNDGNYTKNGITN